VQLASFALAAPCAPQTGALSSRVPDYCAEETVALAYCALTSCAMTSCALACCAGYKQKLTKLRLCHLLIKIQIKH